MQERWQQEMLRREAEQLQKQMETAGAEQPAQERSARSRAVSSRDNKDNKARQMNRGNKDSRAAAAHERIVCRAVFSSPGRGSKLNECGAEVRRSSCDPGIEPAARSRSRDEA